MCIRDRVEFVDHDFQRKTGRSALAASFSSFDQMPLISRPTRTRNTRDARSLLGEEVTEKTRARPQPDARSFLEIEAQEETGITPKSGTEETEEDWGFGSVPKASRAGIGCGEAGI